MSESNDILGKCEAALVAYIASQSLAISVNGTETTFNTERVYAGLSRGRKFTAQPQDATIQSYTERPCIQCICQSAESRDGFRPFSGNWEVQATIRMMSNASDTAETDHKAAFATLVDLICDPDLPAGLNDALADFTCFQSGGLEQNHGIDNDSYQSEVGVTLIACGRTVI